MNIYMYTQIFTFFKPKVQTTFYLKTPKLPRTTHISYFHFQIETAAEAAAGGEWRSLFTVGQGCGSPCPVTARCGWVSTAEQAECVRREFEKEKAIRFVSGKKQAKFGKKDIQIG